MWLEMESVLNEYNKLKTEVERLRMRFEIVLADKRGIKVDELHERGLKAIPCYCGESDCYGWELEYPKIEGLK